MVLTTSLISNRQMLCGTVKEITLGFLVIWAPVTIQLAIYFTTSQLFGSIT